MALLIILSALRFEVLSVMELPRKRLNRLSIIEELFTLCLFKNMSGYQGVQVCLIKVKSKISINNANSLTRLDDDRVFKAGGHCCDTCITYRSLLK